MCVCVCVCVCVNKNGAVLYLHYFLGIYATLISYYLPPIRNTLMKMGLVGCPDTSQTNYKSTLPEIPQ